MTKTEIVYDDDLKDYDLEKRWTRNRRWRRINYSYATKKSKKGKVKDLNNKEKNKRAEEEEQENKTDESQDDDM